MKINDLLSSISAFIQKADDSNDELRDLIKDFPEVETLIKAVDDYETVISKLLNGQKSDLIKAIKAHLGNDLTNPIASAMLEMVMSDIIEADEFSETMKDTSVKFLTSTVSDLTSLMMESIDKDVAFNTLSQRTVNWIDTWSADLGQLMKLNTHEAVQKTLREGVSEGKSIKTIELELRELPQFNRTRARRTAITEVLTASSVSQQEAYMQSPSVTGKTWLHSGGKGINPRPAHVALNGTTIDKDALFSVNGYSAKYPRDTMLPAKERVQCHCVLQPSVDENILKLSKEEKELIRQRVMAELGV